MFSCVVSAGLRSCWEIKLPVVYIVCLNSLLVFLDVLRKQLSPALELDIYSVSFHKTT